MLAAAAAEDGETNLPSPALPTPPVPRPPTPLAGGVSDVADVTVREADACCAAAIDTFAVPAAALTFPERFAISDGGSVDIGSSGLTAALLTGSFDAFCVLGATPALRSRDET